MQIKNSILNASKYVLDADIAKCFDRINHASLLQKLGYNGKIRQQIKAWLKSGVIDQRVFTATSEGTMQGGVISPLQPELSEDGKAGFDFLGYHIQQFPVGKHSKGAIHTTTKEKLGFRTLITPSKDACKKHQLELKRVIRKHKYSHQARLINELNPIIRGWVNYYQFSDAQTTGELTRQDYLVMVANRSTNNRAKISKKTENLLNIR